MLDVLCRQDPSFLYRTLSCLKGLHARLCGDPTSVRALLPLAQFFLTHGELHLTHGLQGCGRSVGPRGRAVPSWSRALPFLLPSFFACMMSLHRWTVSTRWR